MNLEQTIDNKVVVITGGLGGIGSIIVKNFLQNNAKQVVILDINKETGHKFEAELNDEFGPNRAKFIKCDITVEKELQDAFNDIISEQQKVDVLINNAAVMNIGNHKKQVDINVIALMSATLIAMEHMSLNKGGRGGTIINISSRLAFLRCHYFAIYAATKAAVLHFTCCLGVKQNYARTGVRLMTMCFGKTETGLITNSEIFDLQNTKEYLEEYKNIASQKPESAADGVTFAFKNGNCGSVWTVHDDLPPQDITEQYNEGLTTITGSDPFGSLIEF